MKTYQIILVVLISLALLVVFGFRSLVKNIYKQRTCEWANIDNLELHAKLNIPKITSSDCNYSEATNTKKAYFVVNKDVLDIDNYIEANQLKPINKPLDVIAEKFLKFDEFSMVNTSFYYKENKIEGESSYVLFNADEGKLWVTVAYKNLE